MIPREEDASGAPRTPAKLHLAPIDLGAHGAECVAFRADSFAVSFGSPARFFERWCGQTDRYLDHLAARMAAEPGSCVHAWLGAGLVGQIELRAGREVREEGYVNLYYLVPEARGRGLGVALDAYAVAWFRDRGMTRAALSVTPSNERALRFYARQGWRSAGENPDKPGLLLMTKSLPIGDR